MTLIRTWEDADYSLGLYDYGHHYRGKDALTYNFYYGSELIFSGDKFSPSPLHSWDSDKTVAALLGHLSLKPGDTDREHFSNYTPRQLEFVKKHGEYLSLLASDLEG